MAAALAAGHGVDFIDNHGAHGREHAAAAVRPEQHVERFGRGHQNMGRAFAHRAAFGLHRVAGAHGGADAVFGQFHCGQLPCDAVQRGLQIEADIVRQRLQRRDIQHLRFIGQRPVYALAHQVVDGGQKGGQRLAGAGRGGHQCRTAALDQRPRAQLRFGRGRKGRAEPGCDGGMEILPDAIQRQALVHSGQMRAAAPMASAGNA